MRSLRLLQRGLRQYRSIGHRTPSSRPICFLRHAAGQSAGKTNRRWYAASALAHPDGVEADRTSLRSSSGPQDVWLSSLEALVSDVRNTVRDDVGGNELWWLRLDNALRDAAKPRRKKIAVVGDTFAMPQAVVDALLQDPISNPPSAEHAIVARHQDTTHSALEITYTSTPERAPNHVGIPSTWLRNSECDLLEVRTSRDTRLLDAVLSADALVVVVDPYTLGSADFMSQLEPCLSSYQPIIVVVNGTLPGPTTEDGASLAIRNKFTRLDAGTLDPTIVFADSSSALRALEALHSGLQRPDASPSARSKAFELFQHAYLKSRLASLQTLMSRLVTGNYRFRTALSSVALATNAIATVVAEDREVITGARRAVDSLLTDAAQAERHAHSISVISRALDGGLVEGGVDDEVERARQAIDARFRGRYAWTSLLARLKVDDVGLELASYISRNFGAGLERQIIFETGQLAQIQKQLDRQADETIRQMSLVTTKSNPHPLASPILRNHLSTVSLAIPSFTPITLLNSLDRRRRQLVDVSVHRLQSEARRAMMTTTALTMSGLAASWWLYVPPVAAITAVTATGLGMLSVVSAVYLGQRRWDRAQKIFWNEWKRSTEMLKGDLQLELANVMKTRVTSKTIATAEGLQQLIEKREARLSLLEAKLSAIRGLYRRLDLGV